jgi:hypothetical protein
MAIAEHGCIVEESRNSFITQSGMFNGATEGCGSCQRGRNRMLDETTTVRSARQTQVHVRHVHAAIRAASEERFN